MDIDRVLVDLGVVSLLKEQDKLGVLNLPGKQVLVIYSGRYWFQNIYRYYYGSNRADVMMYLWELLGGVEKHSELFTEAMTEKTKVARTCLHAAIGRAMDGLTHLQETYSSDSNIVSQLNLIVQKLLVARDQIVLQ
tara:strand:- start:7126 stop:7533 length:408 start_codon:yes stop_codon:yes gene_type:complete